MKTPGDSAPLRLRRAASRSNPAPPGPARADPNRSSDEGTQTKRPREEGGGGTQSKSPVDGAGRLTRLDWAAAGGLFLLALALRVLFLLGSPDRAWPHSTLYEGDAPTWARWAEALSRGESFEFDLPVRTPGVASLLQWLSVHDPGPSFVAWKIGWCLIASLGCGVFYLACRGSLSRRASGIAASLWACSYGGLVLATSLNNETPYGTLVIGLVWLTLLTQRRSAWWLIGALGLLHGAAMLLRAEHLLLLLMLEAWAWWRGADRPNTMRSETSNTIDRMNSSWLRRLPVRSVAVGVIALVVCIPWIISGANAVHRFNERVAQPIRYDLLRPRWTGEAMSFMDSLPAFAREGNALYLTHLARQSGRTEVTLNDVEAFFDEQFGFVPRRLARYHLVSLKGPLDFALANHPESNGGFSKQPLIGPLTPDGNLSFGHPHHNRLVTEGYTVGWSRIRESPIAWAGLVARKLAIFADGAAPGVTALNFPLGRDGIRRAVDVTTPHHDPTWWCWTGISTALFIGGILLAARQRIGGAWVIIIASKVIVTIAFYGYARQAMSIQPAFLFFMALSIEWGWNTIQGRLPRRFTGRAVAAAILIATLVIGVIDAWRGRALDMHQLDPRGTVVPAPHWGENAFEYPHAVEIRVTSGRHAEPGG